LNGSISRRDFVERAASVSQPRRRFWGVASRRAHAQGGNPGSDRHHAAAYADHPAVRDMYAAELQRNGITMKMPSAK
jgi:hypothetical protein